MAQRYYPISVSSTPPTGCPSSSQSAAYPAAQDNDAALATKRYSGMDTAKPGTDMSWGMAAANYASLATTTQQSCWTGYAYYRVGTQTFGVGTWQCAMGLEESNAAANLKTGISIYIYRVGTGVIGYIYDSLTELGAEATGTPLYRVFSVTGADVAAQNGDYLIVEFHGIGTQSMGSSYTLGGPFGVANSAEADATDGSALDTFSTWLEAPVAITPYSAGPPTSFPFPRRDSLIVPLI